MDQTTSATRPVRPPHGFHPAKVDQAGRVKLPAKYQEYLNQLADRTLFVTKLHSLARMYTNGSWERHLNLLSDDPELRFTYATEADRCGGDVDMDPQGRITLPQALRQSMKLEDTTLQLRFHEDVVLMYTAEQYAAVNEANDQVAAENERKARQRGLF
jgi:DNA-binding transcriptional regulator/RsmH inhibitor MraZ